MIRRFVSTAKQSGLKQSCEQTNYRSPTAFDPAVREVFRSPQSGATYKVNVQESKKNYDACRDYPSSVMWRHRLSLTPQPVIT